MRFLEKGKGTDGLVLFSYLLLSLALTFPLILHLDTHVIGWNIDEGIFLWNTWWLKHSLIDLGSSPFYTTDIFYPIGVSLVFYTLTLVNGIVTMPLQLIAGPVVTLNVTTIVSFCLSAFGMYLLARYLLSRDYPRESIAQIITAPEWIKVVGAFTAGLIFAFSAPRMIYAAQGSSNLTSAEWIPLYILYLIKACDVALYPQTKPAGDHRGNWFAASKEAIIAGIILLLAAFTELTYAVFLLMFTAMYLAKLGWENRAQIRPLFALTQQASLTGITFAIGFAPMLYMVWEETKKQGDYLSTDWGYADAFSADLLGFFTPSRLHPLFGRLSNLATANFTDLNLATVGYVVILLAVVVGLRFRRQLSFWILSSFVFVVLSLGPVLHINGVSAFNFDGLKAHFPLPFIILHYIPLVKGNRMPHRFSILLSLALAVLVAFAVVWVLSKVKSLNIPQKSTRAVFPRLMLATLIPLVISLESLSVPLPLNDVRPSPFYKMLGEDKEDYAILQLPLGWRNSYGMMGIERTMVQAYQFEHGKRMLAGNTSRNPDFKFAYFAGIPALKTIADLEKGYTVPLSQVEKDRKSVQDVLELFDIRYLVVHREYVEPETEEYAREILPLEKVFDDGAIAGYKIKRLFHSEPLLIDFGAPETSMYRGEGWSGNERLEDGTTLNWSDRATSAVYFPNYGQEDLVLKARLKPFVYTNMPDQSAELTVNGKSVGVLRLDREWKEYPLIIPAGFLKKGLNVMEFRFKEIASPNKVLPGGFEIGKTGVKSPVDITIEAAGMMGGDYVRIKVNEQQVSKQGRGYNVITIDPVTGKVLGSQVFDTFGSENESARMARFLEAQTKGTIVVAAVKDDASKSLTMEAVNALRSIGAQGNLKDKFRWSHSLIGVKGASPGEAAEIIDDKAQFLHIGSDTDKRLLGVAADYLKFARPGN